PIDPFYLTWKAREFGKHTRFIELAGEINTAMPEHVVNQIAEALNDAGKPVSGSRILILGLAYKPNVDDDRESPSYHLMELLNRRGAKVDYYDPHVPVIRPTREHPHWAGLKSISWSSDAIRQFDAIVIATAHDSVNYKQLGKWASTIIDTRNAMQSVPVAHDCKVWKA
ncbi:MAG: UDP-glucose/GDP-mannose dehydrogenase, partial [Verrucomicrobiales bacterium]|nr:UDP-glucose/GDP-mannose dehydrogenase [Verrucomicrobiales bacterium]